MKEIIIFTQKKSPSFLNSAVIKIATKYKILFITLYTLLLPYCSIYLLLLQHFIIIIIFLFRLKNYRSFYRHWILMIMLAYLSYIIIAIVASNSSSIIFYLPYQLKIYSPLQEIYNKIKPFNSTRYLILLYINQCLTIELPLLLTRTYLLLINYFTIYNFIKLTTSLEDIIITLTKSILYLNHNKLHSQDSLIIILLSSELIEVLNLRINQTKVSLRLRGLTSFGLIIYLFHFLQLIFMQYQKTCLKLIFSTMSTIYSKDLLLYRQSLWFIT
uniref:Transmembrane protein n=1 Tax=Helminthocladia australis TaxID=260093 RepID=A0A1G4NTX5_9FLOR|nr:Hypothetical protein ORF_5 [Helminthocladia australis]SCW21949.1 Hypothetical protein ORF_5 [Helminthocladia australis]